MTRLLSLFLVLCTLSCAEQQAKEDNVEEQPQRELYQPPELVSEADLSTTLDALKTDRDKIAFLKEVIMLDQKVRNDETEVLQTYGYDSDEHKAAKKAMMTADAQNLQKVDRFTEKFGQPRANSVGRMQAEAVWYTVHHSPELGAREQFYPLLDYAWKNELITGGMYTLYLNRWYDMASGERLMMEGSYTEEDEVAELKQRLKLK